MVKSRYPTEDLKDNDAVLKDVLPNTIIKCKCGKLTNLYSWRSHYDYNFPNNLDDDNQQKRKKSRQPYDKDPKKKFKIVLRRVN